VKLFARIKSGVTTVGELLGNLWRGPFWWTVPLIVLLIPAAIFFVLLQAVPMVSPFIYTIF
jgi:hypothetical protein